MPHPHSKLQRQLVHAEQAVDVALGASSPGRDDSDEAGEVTPLPASRDRRVTGADEASRRPSVASEVDDVDLHDNTDAEEDAAGLVLVSGACFEAPCCPPVSGVLKIAPL